MPSSLPRSLRSARLASAASIALGALLLLAPRRAGAEENAPAEEPAPALPATPQGLRPLGSKGQVVFAGIGSYSFGGAGLAGLASSSSYVGGLSGCTSTTMAGGAGETCTTSVWIAPGVDVVLRGGLTLGGRVHFTSDTVEQKTPNPGASPMPSYSSQSLGIAPRIGYMVSLGEDFAIWPRATVGASAAWGERYVPSTTWTAGADVGLLFRAGKYVLLNVTPQINYWKTTTETPRADAIAQSGDRISASLSIGLGLVLGS